MVSTRPEDTCWPVEPLARMDVDALTHTIATMVRLYLLGMHVTMGRSVPYHASAIIDVHALQ